MEVTMKKEMTFCEATCYFIFKMNSGEEIKEMWSCCFLLTNITMVMRKIKFESCLKFKSREVRVTVNVVNISYYVPPESLPQSNTGMIIGAVCGALAVLVIIAVGACIVMKVLHNRHDYEG